MCSQKVLYMVSITYFLDRRSAAASWARSPFENIFLRQGPSSAPAYLSVYFLIFILFY